MNDAAVVAATAQHRQGAAPAAGEAGVRSGQGHAHRRSAQLVTRVLRVKYGPHEKSVMHSHVNSVAIFQTDGRVKFTYPGGRTEERDTKAGTTMWTPAVSGTLLAIASESEALAKMPSSSRSH